MLASSGQIDVPFAQNMQYLPQNIQMQQRLLAEMAQAEFLSTMQGPGHSERDVREARESQEMLRVEAMRKIMEAERIEEKRKRKQRAVEQTDGDVEASTEKKKKKKVRIAEDEEGAVPTKRKRKNSEA